MPSEKRSPETARRLIGLLLAVVLATSACVFSGSSSENGSDGAERRNDASDRAASGDEASDQPDAANGSEAPDRGELPTGAVDDPGRFASIESVGCSFDEPVPLPVRPRCHSLSVPEDWSDPDPDDRVVLQVAVFEGDGTEPDPLIYFDGGPGGHTLGSLSLTFGDLVEPYFGGRDYIVFDQRGLGLSEPSLSCPEMTEVALADLAAELDPETAAAAMIDAQGACRDRLTAAGVNLEAYNSIASANDVEAIRSLLGYERLNVIGISYGTRLAQTYMRMYPGSIRSVVLDSVFPTGYDLWTNFSPGARRAFEQFFDGCAADPACAATYPELEQDFFELLDRLDDEPAQVQLRNLLDGATRSAQLDGDDVMGLVFNALYNRQQFAAVPPMVTEALAGDYTTIELFGSIQLTNLDFVSLGMRLSVECNEEIPFESEGDFLANEPDDPGYARLQRLDGSPSIFDLCESWPAGRAPDVESESITSELPALILAGQYDPITPPAGADLVASGLPNSFVFLLPNEGHGITPTDCGAELVSAFLSRPDREPDASCIATSPAPNWVPGDDTDAIELVEFESTGLVSVRGVRPADWTDVGNGVFARQQTAVDPTTLLIQPTGGLSGRQLLDLVGGQLGIRFVAAEEIEVNGQSWSSFTTSAVGTQSARAAVEPGPAGVLVLLVARTDEIEALYDALFQPVAEGATAG